MARPSRGSRNSNAAAAVAQSESENASAQEDVTMQDSTVASREASEDAEGRDVEMEVSRFLQGEGVWVLLL